MTTRPDKWDLRLLGLARHVAQWSKDPSTQVGAVIADRKHRVLSLGFNGFARGVRDLAERLENRELKYDMIIHAERNAVLFANAPVDGASVYVWPLLPCAQCAATLIQAGIGEVVAPAADAERAERWAAQINLARTMFAEAGVKVLELEDFPEN